MSLLLEVERTPAVTIKPRLILVTHTDNLSRKKRSTSSKMHIQSLKWIASTPDTSPRELTNCITDCSPINSVFQKHPPTDTQVRNSLCHRNGWEWWWSDLHSGAATATRTRSVTSVIRRSRVPPRAWVGSVTSWSQPDTVAKSRAATSWRFVVVEPNYPWWRPFKSPINRNEARTSTACTAAIAVRKHW